MPSPTDFLATHLPTGSSGRAGGELGVPKACIVPLGVEGGKIRGSRWAPRRLRARESGDGEWAHPIFTGSFADVPWWKRACARRAGVVAQYSCRARARAPPQREPR